MPPQVIVVEEMQGREERLVVGTDTLSTIPSESWNETVSRQSDEEGWRGLPFAEEERFNDLNEEAVDETVQVADLPDREAAAAEESTVRRSTRVRKVPERYGEWVEDWSED